MFFVINILLKKLYMCNNFLFIFSKMMYAKSEDMLEEAVSNIKKEWNKYPQFVKCFETFYERKDKWVLLKRQNLITRGNNTNNYSEATIRILKDIVLQRTKAFNAVALTDFCLTVWEPHLIKKLFEYAHSRKKRSASFI